MKHIFLCITGALSIILLTIIFSSCGSSNLLVEDTVLVNVQSYVRGLDGQAEKYFKAEKYREALELYKGLKSTKENLPTRTLSTNFSIKPNFKKLPHPEYDH